MGDEATLPTKWATSHSAPRSEAVGIPKAEGVAVTVA